VIGQPHNAWPVSGVAPFEVRRRTNSDASRWFSQSGFAVFLALAIVAAFPGVVFGPETFFFRDFGCFGYPLAHYARESFWRGEIPLWNPLNNSGIPFLAQWNSMTLYPPVVFCYLFPLGWSLAVFNLGHLFLAGLGMYRLVSAWTRNPQAASLAGIIFAFNGLTLNCLMWPNNISALGWMPWVILAVDRALRNGSKATLLAALLGTLQMLAGAPEIILMTWAVCGALVLARWWKIQQKVVLFRCALIVLMVAGLSAIQLLPFLELLRLSHRDSGFGTAQWSMPFSGWINFFVPLYHAKPAFHGVYVQEGQFWTSSYYPGLVALSLSVVALFCCKSRRTFLLVGLFAGSVLLAWGENAPFYAWIRSAIPQVGFMRYPIKFIVLGIFALSTLAGFGAAAALSPKANGARAQKSLLAGSCAILLIITGAVVQAWFQPAPGANLPAMVSSEALQVLALFLILACLWAYRRTEESNKRALLWGGILVLTAIGLLTHYPWQNPTVNRSAYAPGNVDELLPVALRKVTGGRAMVSPEGRQQLRFSMLENPVQHMLSRRTALFNNCNLLDGIPKVDGFYSLYPREMAEITAAIYSQTNGPAPSLLDLLAVSQVSEPSNPFDWKRRENSLPLVSSPNSLRLVASTDTLRAVLAPDFNPRETLILTKAEAGPLTHQGGARITEVAGKAAELTFQTSAEQPTWILLSQTCYPHWKAYVNGMEAQVHRANHALQALQVPAGVSRVRVVYEDSTFRAGAAVSLASLLVLGLLWAYFGQCLKTRHSTQGFLLQKP
jgi:hypothetical protein